MKKYLQITVVLTIFALFVLLKQVRGNDTISVVGNKTFQGFSAINNNSNQNTQNQTQPTSVSQARTPATSAADNNMMRNKMDNMMGLYKNGTYTGSVEDAFYGNIQVQAIISNGKITDIVFLQYPNDNATSRYVSSQAIPLLKQEAIQAQNSKVDIVSGASASSQAFQASLANALAKAK